MVHHLARPFSAILALVMLLLLNGASAQAQTPAPASRQAPVVELVNSLGGTITTVAISGTVAYVGEGMSLVALDVSDPIHPVRHADLLLSATVRDLQVISGTAYIANDAQGLQIVDVHNLDSLVQLGSYATPEAATGLYVLNGRVYLACGTGGLLIIDVSDPAHPTLLGTYAGIANKVWVTGTLAAVVDGDLRLLNVSNPAHPTLVGSYITQGDAKTVQVSGTVAYLADVGGLGLATINISNPISPTLLGHADTYSYGDGAVSVAGQYAYAQTFGIDILASTAYCQTQIFDVSDPSQPNPLGEWSRVTYRDPCTGNIQVIGNRVYATDGDLQIVDVSAPLTPTVVGSYLPLVKPSAVAVAGHLVYVADEDGRLIILDMVDPLHPTVLGSYSTAPGHPFQVQVWGERAYVAVWEPSIPISLPAACWCWM